MATDHEPVLERLIAGNERHVAALPADHFAAVQADQHPEVVAVCCSDSRIPQVGMWGDREPGHVFTPSNIGNQVWDEDEGELIVDGSVLYPIHHAGTTAAAIVGHTGCGAVTSAYQVATGAEDPGPRGVTKHVKLLRSVVEEGLESGLIDTEADEATIVNQLVEYNVDRQAQFLQAADEMPADVDVYGFVYDFQEVYGDEPGRAYLVNLNGETDPEAIAAALPATFQSTVRSLLY